MRSVRYLIVCILLVAASTALSAEFKEGVKIECGGKAIEVEIGHLVPCVVDWNEDGKKDLIVGQFIGGNVRLYLNEGSDESPLFKTWQNLAAGGKDISLPAG